jgi:hypothetical protein
MQRVVSVPISIESYSEQDPHELVSVPLKCDGCGHAGGLHRHGVYARWCGDGRTIYRIRVARFLCPGCCKTTSLLPDFALSYRLLGLAVVDLFFRAEEKARQSFSHLDVLLGYWKLWCRRWDGLHKHVGRFFGDLRNRDPCNGWTKLGQGLGGMAGVNRQLIERFGLSLLGRYAIHSPVAFARSTLKGS